MPRDPNILYKGVLVKIGVNTQLRGWAHYRNDTRFIEVTINPGAGSVQEIEEASGRNNLYLSSDDPDTSTNPDFQHKHIRFKKVSADHKIWEFELH